MKTRTKWALKQLLPLKYRSTGHDADANQISCEFRMWLGRVLWVRWD